MIAQLIAGLGLLVFIHELGHFLFAKLFGMRVEKFVIFMDAFGFKLFKFTKGETEYSIGWLPIGGYVKISGMVDESLDEEQLKEEPKPWEFRSFPAWKRIVVLLGGVIFNVITGWIILSSLLYFGEGEFIPASSVSEGIYATPAGQKYGFQNGDVITSINGEKTYRLQDVYPYNVFDKSVVKVDRAGQAKQIEVPPTYNLGLTFDEIYTMSNFEPRVDEVLPGSPSAKSGMKGGDKILAINDNQVYVYGDIRNILQNRIKTDSLRIKLERNGEIHEVITVVDSTKTLGISADRDYKKEPYNFLNSMYYGYKDSKKMVVVNFSGVLNLFMGNLEIRKSVTGPIGIAKIYGGHYEHKKFWGITALISFILAITNLIPIPGLDGGHILIITIESIIGRKLSNSAQMVLQICGLVLVLGLMLFTVVNDIINIVF